MKRLEKLQAELVARGLDGFLVNNLTNIYYLTGFSGSNATLFVEPEAVTFFTDSRYTLAAKAILDPAIDFVETRAELAEVAGIVQDRGLKRIGFEPNVPYYYYQELTKRLADQELVAEASVVEGLRLIKDESEIAIIQEACKISDQAFIDALEFIKIGQTELEIATFLDFRMRELGASGLSFDSIVASGPNSAMPHAHPGQRQLEAGDTLTLDFGCVFQHYASDMTRTIYLDHVQDEQAALHQLVLDANQAVIAQATAGMLLTDFDQAARSLIDQAGYGPAFSHSIGHGMGLEVHEEPFFRAGSEDRLQSGMVVTDEPGIYLDGKYGLRIEDDLWIQEEGCQVLTKAPKELIII
ncbi:aminopeptidase P family protein [Streptococcus danieliae]|uniref:Aminopeptidase P family protein n=1 Tax=Streptococcus danieliae TaxID=747656 RepID=A0A7Z0LCG4_9STRE|nr:Xaa-Pro peptidase family protein [Streptococcus danieliae]MBF0716816.1 aminopeptidase P family protein [Streptococcus danieliae]NYS48746.1 aminopeptidase P family protein [Streptococcus danieliae]